MIKLHSLVFLVTISVAATFTQELPNYNSEIKLNYRKQTPGTSNTQLNNYDYTLKQNNKLKQKVNYYKKTDLPTDLLLVGIVAVLVNPILVFEDKKIFWGLTKEISFAFYPYGRLNFEYSFLFRTFNKNHFRLSYNYDFIEHSRNDWIMFRTSAGAGYFSDTKNSGAFAQASVGYFTIGPFFVFDFYLKYRFTYTFHKDKSNIHDVSLGCGFLF